MSSSLSIATPTLTTNLTPMPTDPPGNNSDNNPNGGGGGGNFNGNGNGNGPSLASSASLYLYTFLATLVLLLSVSAAIVIRSFLLRRRHRRMVEEAIRNGTWIPPAPTGRSGPRVDLSKKPKMWEAYLDLHQQHQQQQMLMAVSDERDWESMKPFMATYISDSAAKKISPTSLTGGDAGGMGVTGGAGTGGGGNEGSTGGNRITRGRRVIQQFTHRLGSAFSTASSDPQFGVTTSNRGTGNNTRQGSSANLPGQNDTVQMTELGTSPGPQKVRVAVLIAMPRRHASPSSSSLSSVPSSSSGSPSTSRSTSASSTPQIPLSVSAKPEEEEDLPHIEMGVAELMVVADSSLSGSMDGARSSFNRHHDIKGKVRESMMSVGSV